MKRYYAILADVVNGHVRLVLFDKDEKELATYNMLEAIAREMAAALLKSADVIKQPEPAPPPLSEPQGKDPYR